MSSTIEADVCIVGAGPAGIAVAHELRDSSLSIVVLESGDVAYDAVLQDASGGEVISSAFGPDALARGRRRQFGGSSNLWLYRTLPDDGHRYARSVPPQEIDLGPRGSGGEGWPMSVDQLRPYQERAQRFWNDAPFDYDPARWSTGRATPFGDGAGTLALAVAQHGSREVFSQRYRQDLLATDAVDVRTMTTAVGLAGASDGGVTGVSARTADGQAIDVRARVVVLAAGGVENAQLLLVTFPPDRGHPANRHDVVGRYLSDHPELRVGYLTLDRAVDPASMADFDVRWAGSTMVSTFLTLDEEFKRREGLLNVSAALVAQSPGIGTATHRTIYSMFGSRSAPSFGRLVGGVLGLARHPRELASYTRSRMRDDRFHEFSGGWSAAAPRSRTFEVHLAAEQTPEPENRITLSTQGDAFGRRRPQLRWSWSARDRENVSRSAEIIRQEVDRMGIGRLDLWLSPASDQLTRFTGLHHPMGSTRISPDPTLGVVDENCRVHGTDNVYVAGSSVFPSGHGYANPTLTVLALAIRLADHIRTVLSAA